MEKDRSKFISIDLSNSHGSVAVSVELGQTVMFHRLSLQPSCRRRDRVRGVERYSCFMLTPEMISMLHANTRDDIHALC